MSKWSELKRRDRESQLALSSRMSGTDAAVSGFQDAISLGWGDELVGLFGGEEATRAARAHQERARADNPTAFMAGQFGGSLAGGLGVTGAARAGLQGASWLQRLGPAQRILLAAGGGAAGAGVYGAGDTQDDTLRLQRGLEAAPWGAGAGAVFRTAGEALGGTFQRALHGRNAESISSDLLAQTMRRDNLDEAGLTKRLTDLAAHGRGGMLYDAFNEGGQHVTMGAAARPSEGRTILRQAFDDRNRRVADLASEDVRKTLGAGLPPDALTGLQSLKDIQEKIAAPLFDAAYRGRLNLTNEAFRNTFYKPLMDMAARNPRLFSPARARAEDSIRRELGPKATKKEIEAHPKFWGRWLENVHAELGAHIRQAKLNPLGAARGSGIAEMTQDSRAFNTVVRRMLGADFRKAQDVYSGAAKAEEAVEMGYDAIKPNLNTLEVGKLRRWMKTPGRTKGELEHARLGAIQKMQDMLANADTGTGYASPVKALTRSEGQRRMLAELFGGEKGFDEVLQRMQIDRKLASGAESAGVKTNSMTAPALAAMQTQEAMTRAPTTMLGVARNLLAPQLREQAEKANEDVSSLILRLMATPADEALAGIKKAGGSSSWAKGRGLLDRVLQRRRELESYRRREAVDALLSSGVFAGADFVS